MSREAGEHVLRDFSELMEYLGVRTLEEASDLVDDYLDFDGDITQTDDTFVVRVHDRGWHLEFPMTGDKFWETINDLETELAEELEDRDSN